MLTALNRLKIRVPGIGTQFTSQCRDAVMAFQKAYRLPRTYTFGYDDWRKLDGAVPVKPRYAGPATHLEVDKGRQILMVVKSGKVFGLICVSTGATNNTPEGAFRIQQKHPYTTSGYGGILFRTMGFVGNFAIHGYVPVPPYPASHGCIREPMWVADWVYDHSFVGERLYVYH
jgi:lipoprotein-anchoring transpeptidase ErfK/SrfK